MSAGRLDGRVAVVTGAAHGIGRAIAAEFAARGAAVAAIDIDRPGLDRLGDEHLANTGSPVSLHQADVGDLDAVARSIADVVHRHRRIDVLVNNAATFEPGVADRDLDVVDTPVGVLDRTLEVNLRGPYVLMQRVIPVMLDSAGRGSIINISSPAAVRGAVSSVAYSASKAALEALTRSVATSHGRAGIRCNAISVGLIMTDNARRTLHARALESREANLLVTRLGVPHDVATVAALLASDDGAYINGQTIVVDGGASAHQPWFSYGRSGVPRYDSDASSDEHSGTANG